MKGIWTTLLMAALAVVAVAHPAHAANPRQGVVTAMEPIENRGTDESAVTSTKRKWGKTIGGLAGLGIIATGKGGAAGQAVGSSAGTIGEVAATKIGDQGPATRYMVKVKLDTGKTLTITQLREQLSGIKVGSHVRVEGKGDAALIYKQ